MTERTVSPARPPRALVVEDDQDERELLADFLRLAGFEVDTARDGATALDYLCAHARRRRPDVLLLDMDLPRCNGARIVHTAREDPAYAGFKIFAVSAYEPKDLGLDSGNSAVDRWFQKPVIPEDLLHELRRELSEVSRAD